MPRPVALPTPRLRRSAGASVIAVFGDFDLRRMIDEIEREGAHQKHGQHFRLERRAEFRAVADCFAHRKPELAAAVDRGGAHQIADLRESLRRAADCPAARHEAT